MQSEQAIVAESVTKTYRAGIGRAWVREMLPFPFDGAVSRLFPRWWNKNTFNAVNDVSFTVPSGSSLGIVGHNGAGKTTLLKLIAGVTTPNRGRTFTSGRIGALLDAVVGFHPDLTGRENVYLLGAMNGFGRKSMGERMSSILDFAEIDELADTPLKRYSSGMSARLGFATITALEPAIFLVDEVLAVGDASFQRKCITWLDGYRKTGGTLLFVSHNLPLVRSMTERAIWMDHGKVAADGDTGEVLSEYVKAMERREPGGPSGKRDVKRAMRRAGQSRWGAGGARVEEVHLNGPHANGKSVEVEISYEASELDNGIFCIGFVDEGGREIGVSMSPPLSLGDGEGRVDCVISPLPLRSGIYFPVVAILSPGGRICDRWKLDRAVVVDQPGEETVVDNFGPVDISASWSNGDGRAPRREKARD